MPEREAALLPLFERVWQRIARTPVPAAAITFYAYVDTKSTLRLRGGRLHIRLSDHLEHAPHAVLEGVLSILVCRHRGVPHTRADATAMGAYHAFLDGETATKRRRESRKQRGRKHIDPIGDHRSLLESFLRVSMDHGLILPEAPKLSWSRTASRRRFGHWDEDHGCIVISRVLDDPAVPAFVMDYVVYHEVLHILHPVEAQPGKRRRIHTAAFKHDEAKFARAPEAEAWLRKLAAGRARRAGHGPRAKR